MSDQNEESRTAAALLFKKLLENQNMMWREAAIRLIEESCSSAHVVMTNPETHAKDFLDSFMAELHRLAESNGYELRVENDAYELVAIPPEDEGDEDQPPPPPPMTPRDRMF